MRRRGVRTRSKGELEAALSKYKGDFVGIGDGLYRNIQKGNPRRDEIFRIDRWGRHIYPGGLMVGSRYTRSLPLSVAPPLPEPQRSRAPGRVVGPQNMVNEPQPGVPSASSTDHYERPC